MEPVIEVPLSVLRELVSDSLELTALDAAGVDNWQGYEYVDWDSIQTLVDEKMNEYRKQGS